jgi:predicted phosphodiesterase
MKHKLRRQFTEEYREQQNSMKRIGLISDTHGTFDQTLKTFLKDVDEIWHAGDIGSPEVADQIAAFKPLRAVYGNIDGGIMRRTYREFLSFECEGVSVLMTHIPATTPRRP